MKDFSCEGLGHSAAFNVGLNQAGTTRSSLSRFSQPLAAAEARAAITRPSNATSVCIVCLSSFMVVWNYSIFCPCWGPLTRYRVPNGIFQGDQVLAGSRCAGLMEQRCPSQWIPCQASLPALLLSPLLVPTCPSSPAGSV